MQDDWGGAVLQVLIGIVAAVLVFLLGLAWVLQGEPDVGLGAAVPELVMWS